MARDAARSDVTQAQAQAQAQSNLSHTMVRRTGR